MKGIRVIALSVLILIACNRKDITPPPPMPGSGVNVIELNDQEVRQEKSFVIDLNKDGTNDFGFGTWLIGDPVEKEDELLFFAYANVNTSLLVDEINGSPIFNKYDIIPIENNNGYEWYPASMVEMITKNTGLTGDPYWEGAWQNVNHKYLAVQVKTADEKLYNGWVELSVDLQQSKLILHRAAISKLADKPVRAGI